MKILNILFKKCKTKTLTTCQYVCTWKISVINSTDILKKDKEHTTVWTKEIIFVFEKHKAVCSDQPLISQDCISNSSSEFN